MHIRATLAAVAVTVGCAATVRAADTAPVPRAVDDIWLPQPKLLPTGGNAEPRVAVPVGAFPNLVFELPKWKRGESNEAWLNRWSDAHQHAWPRLLSRTSLKIEASDGTHEKLLKAQLHQGLTEHRLHAKLFEIGGPLPPFAPPFKCLESIRRVVLELWVGKPGELVPWLEELVLAAKDQERYAELLYRAGAISACELRYAIRHRLKTEEDLWKAKSGGAQPSRGADAKANDPRSQPVDTEWLSTKPPPTLFPEIAPPATDDARDGWEILDDVRGWYQFARRGPRLSGGLRLRIEATDGPLQRLLKAQLHQGASEIRQYRVRGAAINSAPDSFLLLCDCFEDTCGVVVKLYRENPKELIPWLEELLTEAKGVERITQRQFEAHTRLPQRLNQASRVRLRIEAELWKAKNAK